MDGAWHAQHGKLSDYCNHAPPLRSSGKKYDQTDAPLDSNTPVLPLSAIENIWAPFDDEVQFCLTDFLFQKVEMSQDDINDLMDLWALDLEKKCGSDAPFDNHEALYKAINEIRVSSAPWKCFQTIVPEDLSRDAPDWQKQSYQMWFHDPDVVIQNILANPDFANKFDATPYIHLNSDGQCCWSDFMSGNFAWHHSTQIYEANPNTKGAMYVSIILRSNKTTVSIATGNVEYYPKYDRDVAFRLFKKKLYHQSLTAILCSLVPAMTTPVVHQCPDEYYRHVIYDLGLYIVDYPEQVLLAGIVQGWCVKCTSPATNLNAPGDRHSRKHTKVLLDAFKNELDVLWDNYNIHEMLLSDLLHQVIKGSFKDHLVEWVYKYLVLKDGDKQLIAAIPPFPGLQRFPHGHRFKQWTGNDSKALMKVYLAAVAGYLPDSIMKALSAFMDFCYLVQRSDFNESNFSLPRQHAIVHYPSHIMEFSAPNGLCSSITESWHITTIKKPWQHSNHYNALSQMLLMNQCLDKLAALHMDLSSYLKKLVLMEWIHQSSTQLFACFIQQ
ncbi:hypothetical protein ARMSODRAFT_987174 [Armillaria solidipes]|uniref:Fungal-type protein kinase domain-containing protein n=1 Tax=Armillaria solidipes TaxID=1076256 RepID=A0A2H3BW65_9AGAR|nr:hypothetical protein ARMSODRAFT_987174 [Armillaria solidipes]